MKFKRKKLFSIKEYLQRKQNSTKQKPHEHEWSSIHREISEDTFTHLVQHMHQLRDAVPVNYDLKADLKKKLFEKHAHLAERPNKEVSQTFWEKLLKKKWTWICVVLVIVVIFVSFIYWLQAERPMTFEILDEAHVMLAEQPSSEASVSLSSDGHRLLLEQNGVLSMIDNDRVYELFDNEETGHFSYPSWSNEGPRSAVIYEQDSISEVWIINTHHHQHAGKRLIYAEEEVTLGPIYWSDDDQWLAIEQQGKARVLIISQDGLYQYDIDEALWKETIEEQDITFTKKEEALERNEIQLPRSVRRAMEQASNDWFDWNPVTGHAAILLEDEENYVVYFLYTNHLQ